MTRIITFLLCLFASLLLIPIHSECIEYPGHEQEGEIECIVMSLQASVQQEYSEGTEHNFTYSNHIYSKTAILTEIITTPPARIKYHVFRE